MATCPNVNLDSWKNLVAARGEDLAYYLWDSYDGVVPQEEYGDVEKGIMLQIEEMPASRASEETLNKVKEAAKKMGVDIQSLTDYAKAHPEIDVTSASGVADLVRGVIAVSEGKEDAALTEEMVHLATAILEQTNPKMVTEMIAKIERFKIYKQTLEAYKNNKAYQLPNGKPDIRKIKKEAVDKLIAELIINESEGSTEFPELMQEENRSLIRSWWNAITDWIRGIYKKSNISIFEQVAGIVSQGEVGGTVSDIASEGVMFQLSDQQKNIQQKILETRDSIKKVEGKEAADPLLLDSEEANNWYEAKNAEGVYERITKRVTDRVKAWYRSKFPGKVFTKEEQKFNEFKRTLGVKGHKDFEEIHDRYFNKDGTRKEKADPRPSKFNLEDTQMYDMLENYYVELIDSLSKDGKTPLVFSEVIIYDSKNKEAGTIDMLVVEPSGKTHIIDWKFMHIKGDDIAWFKQGAFNIQLGRYKEILRDNYGVKEFGMNRAIPISMQFGLLDKADPKSPLALKGIAIGSVDTTKITDLTLVPVSEKSESTGFEALDKLLSELNGILKQIQKEEVSDEDEREFKVERINTLKRAMRMAQGTLNMSELIKVVTVMRKEGDNIINDYDMIYKDMAATSKDVDNKQLSDFAEEMRSFMQVASVLGRVDDVLSDLIYNPEWEKDAKTDEEKEALADRKQVLFNLSKESRAIRKTNSDLEIAYKKFADKHIGERNLVKGLLSAEAVVKGLSSMFRGASELPTAAMSILVKLTSNARAIASQEASKKVEGLMDIRKRLAERGGDLRKLVQSIYQKDEKGGIVNKLILKFSKDFYKTIDEKALKGGDIEWIKENVDLDAYRAEASEMMKKRIERIKKNRYGETDEEEQDIRERLIEQEKKKWDIDRDDFNGWNNYILKRHPKDTWLSKEYKAIMNDKDLMDLYNFITEFNKEAKDVNYLSNRASSVFLPFVRKTMAESLAWDYGTTAVSNFTNNFDLKMDDAGLGSINEITGELENSIPRYYTYDFSATDVPGVNDYSQVSEDLFKNMILYIQQVEKYKYMSEVEGQIKLVKTVEEFKNHLKTNRAGDVVFDADGKPEELKGNDENTQLFDQFMRNLLYGQKYVLSDADVPLGIGNVANFIKKAVNKVTGREVFKPNDNPSATSLIKTMDAANRAFQLKTLGLDFMAGAINIFGANLQVAAQSGNYFKAREFLANETKLVGNRFSSSEEREMFVQLIDAFLPLKEDPNYENLKKAGMTRLTRQNFSDMLMFFMREPEQHVEKTMFLTLLDNVMVDNGKIVNIRDFVKNKYKGRGNSSAVFRETQKKIEEEIEELKRTKSISATKKLENGKLVIPGLDMSNRDEMLRLSNLTRRLSANVTGSLSESDINKMQMSVWTRSMMVFKNWIPKLIDTRFSEFRKVSDDFSVRIEDDGTITGEKYDVGRMRLWFYVIGTSIKDKTSNVMNILNMNDRGVEALDKMYEDFREKYRKQTGKELNMSKDDFIDLVRTNLRNQMKELAILLSLLGASFSLGFMAPDDDDDRATKNRFRYYQKVIDKFIGEVSFFYSPEEFQRVLSGSVFPAVSVMSDIERFISNLSAEITGMDLDDETETPDEVRQKSMPIKYGARMIPLGKSLLTYISIFDSDFAKEFDITIQKENNLR